MKRSSLALAVAFSTIVCSSPVLAQGVPTGRAVAVAGAPVLAQQPVGVRRASDAPSPLKKPAPFRADTRQNRALMIVGGAGMLTGLVIGHDAGVLISVGGAVVFLWGLYQYLQ